MRKPLASAAALVALAVIALLDYLTPQEVNLGLFYLALVVAVAWFVDWRAGIVFALLCTAAEAAVDIAFHPQLLAITALNALTRIGILGIAVGLVYRVQHERSELRRSNREREMTLRLLRREFPRPLRALDWFGRTFDEAIGVNEPLRRNYAMLRHHLRELAFLSTDVLAVGQLHSGGFSFARERLELRAVVSEAADESLSRARIIVTSGTDVFVFADPDRLRHAIASVLDRCLDSSSGGTVRVLVRASMQDGVVEFAYAGRALVDDDIELARLLMHGNRGDVKVMSRDVLEGLVSLTVPLASTDVSAQAVSGLEQDRVR